MCWVNNVMPGTPELKDTQTYPLSTPCCPGVLCLHHRAAVSWGMCWSLHEALGRRAVSPPGLRGLCLTLSERPPFPGKF